MQFKYLEAQWKAAALPVNPFVDLRDMYDWQYERRPGAMDVPGVEDGLLKVVCSTPSTLLCVSYVACAETRPAYHATMFAAADEGAVRTKSASPSPWVPT